MMGQQVEQNVILEWIDAALEGADVSDFGLSFPIVRRVVDKMQALRDIAAGPCLDTRGEPAWTCQANDGTGLWCPSCIARGVVVEGK